jgi:S1-C subfamily serine protease
VVVKGSPAFIADIFRSDLLLRIGGSEINSVDSYRSAILANRGRVTEVVVFRDGKEVFKQVPVGP